MMKPFIVSAFVGMLMLGGMLRGASADYWYSDNGKRPLYRVGYSETYHAPIYAETAEGTRRKVSPHRIIVSFRHPIHEYTLQNLMQRYHLKLIKKIGIGSGYYLFECLDPNDVEVANTLREQEPAVLSSYSDWLYLP